MMITTDSPDEHSRPHRRQDIVFFLIEGYEIDECRRLEPIVMQHYYKVEKKLKINNDAIQYCCTKRENTVPIPLPHTCFRNVPLLLIHKREYFLRKT